VDPEIQGDPMSRNRVFRSRTLAVAPLAAVSALGLGVGLPAVAQASHSVGVSQLVDVRAATHSGYDRLVFEFNGKLPSSVFVGWASKITRDGSGDTVPAAGNAFLQIGMSGVTGLNSKDKPTISHSPRTYATRNIAQVVHAGEFEGMLSYGASMMAKTSYTITKLKSPSRVVIDVKNSYPRTSVPVTMLDQDNYADGTAPYTRKVTRAVPSGSPAGGALTRLFAGPTAAEKADGLRLVRSGATGWKNLSISGGVARVWLKGGCNSGGSTFTIADQIIPTLKAFASVDYVKVYSPSGQTASPSGKSDSIPSCLEP
jgi:hypothetical protein